MPTIDGTLKWTKSSHPGDGPFSAAAPPSAQGITSVPGQMQRVTIPESPLYATGTRTITLSCRLTFAGWGQWSAGWDINAVGSNEKVPMAWINSTTNAGTKTSENGFFTIGSYSPVWYAAAMQHNPRDRGFFDYVDSRACGVCSRNNKTASMVIRSAPMSAFTISFGAGWNPGNADGTLPPALPSSAWWALDQFNWNESDQVGTLRETNKIRYWNGNSWVTSKKVNYWNGNSWVAVPIAGYVKYWNGASWVEGKNA